MVEHAEWVDGFRLPAWWGGHPVLDFCNTYAGWDGYESGDYLKTYEHLAVWSGRHGLLPAQRVTDLRCRASREGDAALAVLERTRRFRGALYAVLRYRAPGGTWEGVLGEVRAAAAQLTLRAEPGGEFRWDVDAASELAAPLHAVAWAAAGLLTSSDCAHVRACPGRGCGWMFLDRRDRRRWCTMAICGNRAKARRFEARQRAGR
jgi:predicted RNA-binding Zn ribbon-like protein